MMEDFSKNNTNTAMALPLELVIIDSVLVVVTLAGNILTMCAIIVTKKLSMMISNQFIFSLAVSDFLVGLTVPYHLVFHLEKSLGEQKYTCILRFVLTCLACSSSIYNLLATATDRYVAIIHPLHYNRCMTRKAATALIFSGWFLAFFLATMPTYWNTWENEPRCKISVVMTDNYVKLVLTPMFSVTWIAMFFVYLRIWREAAGHAKRLKNNAHQGAQIINDSKSVQVVLLILGCFSLCWLPYFIIIIINTTVSDSFNLVIYESAFTLAIANSGMNPLIYAWKNTNFRQSFWCLLRCKSPNTVMHKNSYITNHLPSKKNSLHDGICNGTEQELTRSELDIEMQRTKLKQQYENKRHEVEYDNLNNLNIGGDSSTLSTHYQ